MKKYNTDIWKELDSQRESYLHHKKIILLHRVLHEKGNVGAHCDSGKGRLEDQSERMLDILTSWNEETTASEMFEVLSQDRRMWTAWWPTLYGSSYSRSLMERHCLHSCPKDSRLAASPHAPSWPWRLRCSVSTYTMVTTTPSRNINAHVQNAWIPLGHLHL